MTLWTRFRSLHWGWQIAIGAVLISFWPLLFIALPVFAYYGLRQKPRAYRLGAVVVALLPIVVFAGVMSEKESREMQRQQAAQQNAPTPQPPASTHQESPVVAAEPVKAETPFERIVSIVDKYGEYPTIVNLDDINARNPSPPYEVIVVMGKVKSCFSAKDKALGIMRDLYLDPVAGPAIVRVKAINNEYLSASLGADDARSVPAETFKANGPTNFIKALQGAAKYDMDDVQEATSATISGYTFAELEAECL